MGFRSFGAVDTARTITSTFVVASQAAMLALVAEEGDVAIRTDESRSYILRGEDPSVLANWEWLRTPVDEVTQAELDTAIAGVQFIEDYANRGDAGATQALDLNDKAQRWRLTQNTTMNLPSGLSTDRVHRLLLAVDQDATGGRTLAFGGTAPGAEYATDVFTAADGTDLAGRATTTGGLTWGTNRTAHEINGNQLTLIGGANAFQAEDLNLGVSDFEFAVTFVSIVDNSGWYFRGAASAEDGWRIMRWSDGQLKLVAPGGSIVAAGGTMVNGDRITVTCIGSSIVVKRNGVQEISYTSGTNSTGTRIGPQGASVFDLLSISSVASAILYRGLVSIDTVAGARTYIEARTVDGGATWVVEQLYPTPAGLATQAELDAHAAIAHGAVDSLDLHASAGGGYSTTTNDPAIAGPAVNTAGGWALSGAAQAYDAGGGVYYVQPNAGTVTLTLQNVPEGSQIKLHGWQTQQITGLVNGVSRTFIYGGSGWYAESAYVDLQAGTNVLTFSAQSASISRATIRTPAAPYPWTPGRVHFTNLTGNETVVITAAPATVGRARYIFKQDATGGRTITWPASVVWINGTPAPTRAANSVEEYELVTTDGGVTWYGVMLNQEVTQAELDAVAAQIAAVANTPTYVGGTTGNSTVGGQNLATPAGAAVGDLLVASVGEIHMDAVVSAPSGRGWVALPVAAMGNYRQYTWYKVIEAGETAASYQFSFPGYQAAHALDLWTNTHRGAPVVLSSATTVAGGGVINVAGFADDDEATVSAVIVTVSATGYVVTPQNGYTEHRDGGGSDYGSRWVGSRVNAKGTVATHQAGSIQAGADGAVTARHLLLRGEAPYAAREELTKVDRNRQTASYTLVLADAGKAVEMNVAGANNLTVPDNATVAFPIGTIIEGVQYGAGQTTIVAAGGVTIRQREAKLKSAGQWAVWALEKIGTDEWLLSGDLAA